MSEECYSGHAEVPLVNALDECRAELTKLKEGAREIAAALDALTDKAQYFAHDTGGPFLTAWSMGREALAIARELGLLEDK